MRLIFLLFLSFISLVFSCLEPNIQCGGIGWTKQINCCPPLQCKFRTFQYSQCLYIPPSDMCMAEYDPCTNTSDCCPGLKCAYSPDDFAMVCMVDWIQDGKVILRGQSYAKVNMTPITANTSMFWDCCQPTCLPKIDFFTTCAQYLPFYDKNNSTVYAFATANTPFAGDVDCCTCYEVNLTSPNRRFVFQVINKYDFTNNNDFNISTDRKFYFNIPGKTMAKLNNCITNKLVYNLNSLLYKTVSFDSGDKCKLLPVLDFITGCSVFQQSLKDLSDAQIKHRRVFCPSALADKSQCRLADDSLYPS